MSRQPVLLLLTGLLCFPEVSFSLDAREVFKAAESGIVSVLAADAKGEKSRLGSGILVSPMDVVTSCVVVDSAADIVVTQASALRIAKLRYFDKERDLCQLQMDSPLPSAKPVSIARSPAPLAIGQDLFAISSPKGMDRALNRVMISAFQERPGLEGKLIVLETPVSPASIGGGIFDQESRLTGMLTPLFKQGDSAQIVVPAEWIGDLARRNPDRLLAVAAPKERATTATTPAAERTDPAAAWMPRSGDRWKYKMTYGKQDVGTVSVEIVDVRAKTVTERVTHDRMKGFVKERLVEMGFDPARFQPVVSLPGGYQLMDLAPYADPETGFKSGQTWKDVRGDFAPQGGSNTKVANSKVTVFAIETVRVPAGSFKAWKVESISESMYYLGLTFVAKCTYWYAPEMKRTVKMNIYMKASADTASSNETYELVSFEPGK